MGRHGGMAKDFVRYLWFPLLMILTVLASGCGHIATYTDADLKGSETGILYYPPKPYVLVARTGSKDKPNDVQVVYLPDLSKPRYAVMKAGYGSAKLSLAFSNGVLVSAGQETDPKITEAITALAGIPGALANAAKTRAETDEIRQESSDLPKFANSLRSIAADIEALVEDSSAERALTPSQKVALKLIPQQLKESATYLDRPDTRDAAPVMNTLEGMKKQLEDIKPGADSISDADKTVWAKLRRADTDLGSVINGLKPKEELDPLMLYEVLIGPAGTTLRAVPLNTLDR
jgi:hypothetical protein